MEFGIQFFPSLGPSDMPAASYFAEMLELTTQAERCGYQSVRTVEHYFHPYGGYSPNPIVFLAAASQRTSRMRLVTGAVLPAFNNPLKLAGEIGMLDAISGGRLEVGFARAFLPHEFNRFGIDLDESRARFDEGIEAVRLLLEDEDVAFDGPFHSFPTTTSLPRPTQQPRPPFWVAALSSEESFVRAGEMGHGIMGIPMGGAQMRELIQAYREAWRGAGHPGDGRVMLAFHMFCAEDEQLARSIAREPLNSYLAALVDAAGDWTTGQSSADYPGYDKIIAKLAEDSFENQVETGGAWVGTPATIVEQIKQYDENVGGFEVASVQVKFHNLPFEHAQRSLRLFGDEVIPQLVRTAT